MLETTTREVTKEFEVKHGVLGISLVKDDKSAIIVGNRGSLSIIDLETLEISLIAKKIKNKELTSIIVV